MNKVIKKQQAAQTRNSLESLTKQDISDPTTSYSVSLTNIPLVALSSLHGVYAHWQIQINNNPIPRQSAKYEVHLPCVRCRQQRQRAVIFFITPCTATADNSNGRRLICRCRLLMKSIWARSARYPRAAAALTRKIIPPAKNPRRSDLSNEASQQVGSAIIVSGN